MNSRPLWPAWTREPSPSSSWNHVTPPPPSKANCQFRLFVTSSNRRLDLLAYQSTSMCNHWQPRAVALVAEPQRALFDVSIGFCFRLLSIKEMSVRSSTTPSPSSGRSWTTLDMRRQCPLSASWYLQSTRTPWTAYPGKWLTCVTTLYSNVATQLRSWSSL